MATVGQCRSAVTQLVKTLDGVSADLRSKHVPNRTITCRVKDLDVVFTARVDEHGVHDLTQVKPNHERPPQADVRVSLDSDALIALANGEDDFVTAWLHGRVQVSAPVRDMLRLRSIVGL